MYYKNQLIHTKSCSSCQKSYCNNCYSISLEEIELLIEQLEDQILTNSEGWMNKIRYDFKSCYNKETHLICGVYLRFLKKKKNILMFRGIQILKKFEKVLDII